jgi:hypothetical protein
MIVSYEQTWRSLGAIGDQPNCFVLKWFETGFIDKVIIKQVGAEDGRPMSPYVVRIYNSKKPCEGGSESSGGVLGTDPNGVYEASPESYLFYSPWTMGAGELLAHFFETPRRFQNRDGTPNPAVPTLPQHFIYVQITPEGAGDSTWDVTLGGYTDV